MEHLFIVLDGSFGFVGRCRSCLLTLLGNLNQLGQVEGRRHNIRYILLALSCHFFPRRFTSFLFQPLDSAFTSRKTTKRRKESSMIFQINLYDAEDKSVAARWLPWG